MGPRGRGGGRGRGGRGGSQRIGGAELAWDPDLGNDKPQPTATYPPYNPPQPQPLTPREKRQVAHFLAIRKCIHEGPYYTVLGDNVRVGKKGNTAAASFDPFEGMPTYGQKYTKKRRKLPNLSCRPYALQYFPKELHSTLDPTIGGANGVSTVARGKKPSLLKARPINGADGAEDGTAVEGDEDDEPKDPNLDDDDPMDAEEADNDYDDDDTDGGGDYNAERYFDDGDNDFDDDTGGDGDEGGGDYF